MTPICCYHVAETRRGVEEVLLVITCPQCRTQYQYDESRFDGAKSKRLKCPKCSEIFEVRNPAAPEGADATYIKGSKKVSESSTASSQPMPAPAQPDLPQLAPLPKDVRFSLAVIAGSQAGTVFKITKPRVFLGRGSNMDVQLKDGEVSRRHSMIEIRNEDVTLIDLGATNGTFVAGERIERADLQNQSEFTLGSTTLMLIITHDPDAQ